MMKPRVVTDLPNRVRIIDHQWIAMSDGVRLAAKLWLPEGAEREPVPGVLEYIPYRKRDFTVRRDARMHGYLAGHGYACVRVDIRGTGDSEGVLTDEYLERELRDGEEILRWMASQPWCTGKIGMIGLSWGGFNALQIASRRPPELAAIVTVCSSDNRYVDDVHYMGGCLLGDNLSWGSAMLAYTAGPPDPEIAGEAWRDLWMERLQGSGLWLATWLSHQHRDSYWKHGSVCEDYASITCPVMAVSGWADGYSNTVFRLLAGLQVPRKGLVGPWSHKYPHEGLPGPPMGFLQEVVRWWDTWLKGRETGVMDEPMLRAWMQDSVPPLVSYQMRPGRWVVEHEWPSPEIEPWRLRMTASGYLAPWSTGEPEHGIQISSPLSLGQFAGKWCSYSAAPDLPYDQREEDGGALVFDTEPLEEHVEILGSPLVELMLTSNRPVAQVAVRLSDIAEDGKATRVTYGLLNLTHRDSHAAPTPLEPGRRYRIDLELNEVAYAFPAGHRIRVALSTSYWPLAWPPPEPVTLTVFAETSRVTLPVRPPRAEDEHIRQFAGAEVAPEPAITMLELREHNWFLIRDLAKEETSLEVRRNDGLFCIEDIGLVGSKANERYTVSADDSESVRGETHWERRFSRDSWSVRTVTHTLLTTTAHAFHLSAELDAYENERRVCCKSWNLHIPRNLL